MYLTTFSMEGDSKQHPLVELCPTSHMEKILKLSGRMEKTAGFLEIVMPPCAVEVGLDNSIAILHEEEKTK